MDMKMIPMSLSFYIIQVMQASSFCVMGLMTTHFSLVWLQKLCSFLSFTVANQYQKKMAFHMDDPFNWNGNSFPVMVLWLTDAQQQIHP